MFTYRCWSYIFIDCGQLGWGGTGRRSGANRSHAASSTESPRPSRTKTTRRLKKSAAKRRIGKRQLGCEGRGRKSGSGRSHVAYLNEDDEALIKSAAKRMCLVEHPWRNYETNAKSYLHNMWWIMPAQSSWCVFMLGGEGGGIQPLRLWIRIQESKSMRIHAYPDPDVAQLLH